jgi:hypothetical protein
LWEHVPTVRLLMESLIAQKFSIEGICDLYPIVCVSLIVLYFVFVFESGSLFMACSSTYNSLVWFLFCMNSIVLIFVASSRAFH